MFKKWVLDNEETAKVWERSVPIEKLVEVGQKLGLKILTSTSGSYNWFLRGGELPAEMPEFKSYDEVSAFIKASGFKLAEIETDGEKKVEVQIMKAVVEDNGVRIFRTLRSQLLILRLHEREPDVEAEEIMKQLELSLWGENGNEVFIPIPRPVASFPEANIDLGFADERNVLFKERIEYLERTAESREIEARELREEAGRLKKLLGKGKEER